MVAVIAIVVGAWAAFRSANPRRALYIAERSAVALLRSTRGLDDHEIEVRRQGRVLNEPHVVTVDVASRGARDIPRSAFDGQPLKLDFGVPVVALLDQRSDADRPAVPSPKVVVTQTGLEIGPALLTRNHLLTYTLLVEGPPYFQFFGELADVNIYDRPVRRISAILPLGTVVLSALILGIFSSFISSFNWLTYVVSAMVLLASAAAAWIAFSSQRDAGRQVDQVRRQVDHARYQQDLAEEASVRIQRALMMSDLLREDKSREI
ncbi:hypothetical protein SK571_45510 [Lentzea sp. BCCO 10_0798]|uniref:Uncharacterized protein n=1 Tax=Lentzea kristufekii TaxID=3095430 RepID=A0ABU4U8I7_9PSEU|nr:hypothetical protein [Lentzea sp. BCCO 10_0798]MDX8056670.1 hypothetical protein [Lentzea sp. BCCO 10_0798]